MTVSIESLKNCSDSIGIIGLGYVGLPLALALSNHFSVIGFDLSQKIIDALLSGKDPSNEVNDTILANASLTYTHHINDIKDCSIYIVTVPSPIDKNNQPDLSHIKSATESIEPMINPGNIIIYESTVFPGCTEEICCPILEQNGLILNKDFYLGYSPERISPGDTERTLTKVIKIISASNDYSLSILNHVYGAIIDAGLYKSPSIKVAEAAKVIENIQRDVNVAFVNELSLIFKHMDINTLDVIDAAASKWNFMKMYPGLVGGHCIGVDPYYLTYKAQSLGYHPEMILSGRKLNNSMGPYVAHETIKLCLKHKKSDPTILIMGLTFKENISDIRNSKVPDIIDELIQFDANIILCDPHAQEDEVREEYGYTLTDISSVSGIDGIIIAVPHQAYLEKDLNFFTSKISGPDHEKILIDVKGIFNHHPDREKYAYWVL